MLWAYKVSEVTQFFHAALHVWRFFSCVCALKSSWFLALSLAWSLNTHL